MKAVFKVSPNPDELEPSREMVSSLTKETTGIAPGPLCRGIFVGLHKISRLRD